MVNFNIPANAGNLRLALVSIPQRDFGEFQLPRLTDSDFSVKFQSLKGILVNFNQITIKERKIMLPCVSIPQRDFGEFQRDIIRSQGIQVVSFQSLKGILVNFNFSRAREIKVCRQLVSIPQRDFGEFQPEGAGYPDCRRFVSIPQRDFGEFQRWMEACRWLITEFQSLKGILVNFNLAWASSFRNSFMFQSLKGILVNFNWPVCVLVRQCRQFQSLKGILVNFNQAGQLTPIRDRSEVSIPQRDFGEFQPSNFQPELLGVDSGGSRFNPSKGFW
ncbi:Epoxyqueuosine (oQ) reductase QueG [Geitlerinema sp. FC II]|nr:Epoxyqueuosine (oQ) reductase QueG [Geitlerinema sp. FC II]